MKYKINLFMIKEVRNINYYFEPVNLMKWNMFDVVKSIGHIEPFLAVKGMQLDDLVFLYVGQQDKSKESGVYAYGKVIRGPYILKNSPKDYCNGKNTVDVKIEYIRYNTPLLNHEQSKKIFTQFRTVHKLNDKSVTLLLKYIKNQKWFLKDRIAGYIAVTAQEWFDYLEKHKTKDCVNFWRKNTKDFKCIDVGQPFFFLVKNEKGVKGERKVLGYGLFKDYEVLKIDEAWNKYKYNNGVKSKDDFKNRMKELFGYDNENNKIGCIILSDLVFFHNSIFLSKIGIEFKNSIVSGKSICEEDIHKILKEELNNKKYISTNEYNKKLQEEVKKANKDNRKKRLVRLSKANKKPKVIHTITTSFKRNPDVIVEVLKRAHGICEKCGKRAPFIRASDGTPYLEVHHIVPLSEGGEDTIENAIAVCPNCHRKVHFGIKE